MNKRQMERIAKACADAVDRHLTSEKKEYAEMVLSDGTNRHQIIQFMDILDKQIQGQMRNVTPVEIAPGIFEYIKR